ncbi:ML domain-containing protein [Trichostrongylus colubriformis]|uniref:ML domain-containing protein n=1 Tax=Trichostrongylus colubriformis TaxID=6319 RepID=A0AAN8FYD7_TRICO
MLSDFLRQLLLRRWPLGQHYLLPVERSCSRSLSTESVALDQLNVEQPSSSAMWKYIQLLALAILALHVSADFQKIGFKDCKSKFKVLEVQASGCELKDTPTGRKLCEFKEGTTPRIRIKFIPDETVSSLKTQIKAKIGQTFLEFPMADADACKYGILELKAYFVLAVERGSG